MHGGLRGCLSEGDGSHARRLADGTTDHRHPYRRRPGMTGFIIESFTPMARNSLLGFATVQAPSGMVFHDVAVHRQNDSLWVSPASKPMLDRNGVQMKDANGKLRWTPIVSFKDKQARDRWSRAVIGALKSQHPEVVA